VAENEPFVSELFDPMAWRTVEGFALTDVTYHRAIAHGTVRVAINRPLVRNAFRPRTVDELYMTLDHARQSPDVGCVLLTGNGPSPKDGGWAFSSGGDQSVRGASGYEYEYEYEAEGEGAGPGGISLSSANRPGGPSGPGSAGSAGVSDGRSVRARLGRLHILEVQRLIRFMPKVVIAVVPGWAAGGGHSLHVVCDLTIASAEHARFRQTDADVASFDGGYGSAYLARQVGQKRAREVFFLGKTYDAQEAFQMGMVNAVVPHSALEAVALGWGAIVNEKSPMSVRMLKYAFNLVDDGLVGQQLFAGEATRLAYMTEEAAEGRDAFLDRRSPDWSSFPWYY
jgi:naphthoate synthase